jgi:Flp pilus assembly protein TadG
MPRLLWWRGFPSRLPRLPPDPIRSSLKDQSGGTLLEMALTLPPFFLMLFGLFEFSIILFGYCSATFACREAARYASVHSSTSLAPCTSSAIKTLVASQIWAPTATVTVTPTWAGGNTIGQTVSIAVTVAYPLGLTVISTSTITVGGSATRTIIR